MIELIYLAQDKYAGVFILHVVQTCKQGRLRIIEVKT